MLPSSLRLVLISAALMCVPALSMPPARFLISGLCRLPPTPLIWRRASRSWWLSCAREITFQALGSLLQVLLTRPALLCVLLRTCRGVAHQCEKTSRRESVCRFASNMMQIQHRGVKRALGRAERLKIGYFSPSVLVSAPL